MKKIKETKMVSNFSCLQKIAEAVTVKMGKTVKNNCKNG